MSQQLEAFPMTEERHHPGGKVMYPLPAGVKGSAIFGGERGEYRYRLERVWDAALPTILFVMMNPSTADPSFDDPTVAKCRKYATRWGYGRLLVGNVFALRCTDPKMLRTFPDPIGPDNDEHLIAMALEATLVIFAYGKPHKSLQQRGPEVARMLQRRAQVISYVLDQCDDGTPKHPLYLKDALEPYVWFTVHL